MVDRPHICINALSIDRAVAQGPFWPARTNHRWVYPGAGTLMPFGLGNGAATYRRLQQAMLMPSLLGRGELAAEISKVTGESKPETWLDDYRVAVQIGSDNDNVAMKHLPLMLDGSARAWLNQLAPSSIYSWADLARVFIKTFEGTCKHPAGLTELQYCIQKPSESLHDFIQRLTTLHHTVENVTEHQAVCAFKVGVRYRELYLKFGRTGDMSMSKMMEIATRYANGEEEDCLRSSKGKAVDGDANSNRKQKQKVERTPQAEAAALAAGKFKGKAKVQFPPKKFEKQSGPDALDQPCAIHTKVDEEGNTILPKHTIRKCRPLIRKFGEDKSSEKYPQKEDDEQEDHFPKAHATLMIFADVKRKSQLKVVNQEVNMAAPSAPTYLK
ncbi:hypothetical protein ZWY2020_003812 [Hordeum vulgare]|nr:hypothetical protein ZWY2020_003812 [Hordeum vulgare]